MPKFDHKTFNGETFGQYVSVMEKPNKNELIKSSVIVTDERLKALLSTQTGSHYGTIPIYGTIGGDAQNYDGKTDIESSNMDTYEQSVIAVGRAHSWTEHDFSTDITAGVDFMREVARQVSYWWDGVDTGIVMSILEGIFSMTGTANLEFVNKHTYDISGEVDAELAPTTLNTAVQKASGDKRGKFTMVFMHSAVATNLENQNLLQYLKYTDDNGIQRPLPLATWNGRMVIIDDGMPAEVVEDGETTYTKYTTYVFGQGAFGFAELGAEMPYEMSRDPKTNGGKTTLYVRRRMCYAPKGISFTKASVASLSPTDAELADGANWTLVNNGEGSYFNHKDIAIARIISKG